MRMCVVCSSRTVVAKFINTFSYAIAQSNKFMETYIYVNMFVNYDLWIYNKYGHTRQLAQVA